MNKDGNQADQNDRSGVSRRRFLQASKNVAVWTVVGSTFSGTLWLDDAVAAIPVSQGYLLVDTKKCPVDALKANPKYGDVLMAFDVAAK